MSTLLYGLSARPKNACTQIEQLMAIERAGPWTLACLNNAPPSREPASLYSTSGGQVNGFVDEQNPVGDLNLLWLGQHG